MKVTVKEDPGANTCGEGHVSCHNRTVYKARVVSASWGEWSQVHFNACFISPLILIKRVLSRLLGINIDWFWHYGGPRGSGLLFQGSCICFWLLTLPFWCVGNIRNRAIPTCLRYDADWGKKLKIFLIANHSSQMKSWASSMPEFHNFYMPGKIS